MVFLKVRNAVPDFTLVAAEFCRKAQGLRRKRGVGCGKHLVRFIPAPVPALRFHAKGGDRNPATAGTHHEIDPERAVLTPAFDHVARLNVEVFFPVVFHLQLPHRSGLMHRHSLRLHGLMQRDEARVCDGFRSAQDEDLEIFVTERACDGGVDGFHKR